MKKCKLCLSIEASLFYVVNKYRLYKCIKCQVLYIYPLLSTKALTKTNLQKYESEQTIEAYFQKKDEIFKRAKRSVKILKLYKRNGKLLDIGCSYGFYLEIFKSYGYNVKGIDISKQAINYVNNTLKINAEYSSFEKYIVNNETFDIITIFDVFEHFSNPKSVIIKIKKILKKGGVLVLQTPNYKSIISRIAKEKWFWLLVPEHTFLYSEYTLRYFLVKNGFEVLKAISWDDFEEFINNLLFILRLKPEGKTQLLYLILVKILWVFYPLSLLWSRLGLGGEITIYAQKND